LRALGRRIVRVERRGAVERIGRLLEARETVEQIAAMQMIFRAGGGERQCAVYCVERLLGPSAQHFGRRQQPISGGVVIRAGECRRHDLRRLVVPARAQ
jgi:hypothetical protein